MRDSRKKVLRKLLNEVTLRPINEEDFPFYREVKQDPLIRKLVGAQLPTSDRRLKRWYEWEIDSDTEIVMAMLYKGELAGFVDIHNIFYSDRHCSFATYMKPSLIRSGVGQVAAALALDMCFNQLNMHKVKANYCSYNWLSGQCQLNAGFEVVGIQKEEIFFDGKYHDLVLTTLFEDTFRAYKAEFLEAIKE